MRVSQIQNLTWAGNCLVLAGLGWVGWQFWLTHKATQKPLAEPKWPAVRVEGQDKAKKPDFSHYGDISNVPINGLVPVKKTEITKPPPPPDKWTEFQSKLLAVGGMEVSPQSDRSIARINYGGKDYSVMPGEEVADSGFQLLQLKLTTNSDRSQTMHLVFKHPDGTTNTKDLQIPAPQIPYAPDGQGPVRPVRGGVVGDPVPETGPILAKAYEDPATHDWVIPEAEQNWIAAWGEQDVLAKVATKPDVDAQGVSHGLRIMGPLEAGAPALAPHGINPDDVIRSIDGKPITSKEDVLNYLRGEGKGREKYSVVVDYNGKTRTIVYRVPVAPRRSPRD